MSSKSLDGAPTQPVERGDDRSFDATQDRLGAYRRAEGPIPGTQWLWPLYGAGFGSLGRDGRPIAAPVPEPGPDELLVRHDATGLCYSDVKVIRLGPKHPRIHRDMRSEPVVLGHEVSLTVIRVGDNLRGHYHAGDRFVVQADIFVDGVGVAYGYEIQGGLSQYAVIDQRVLNGDGGNYLVRVRPTTGYAEAALAEPWACVLAAYHLSYRTTLKPGGTTWIVGTRNARLGTGADPAPAYTIGAGFDQVAHPARLMLSAVPDGFCRWLHERSRILGVEVIEARDLDNPPVAPVDDIIVLGADADFIEATSPHLAASGVLAIVSREPLPRKVAVDAGRIHYNRWAYVGGPGPDIAGCYSDVPIRSALTPGGRAWFLGAGGPMGRMHVAHALSLATSDAGPHGGPASVLCTDVSESRLEALRTSFAAESQARGIEFVCLNPQQAAYQATLRAWAGPGFDDIVVLAPVPAAIAEAAGYLAPGGVLNLFAGLARGTRVGLDLSDVYLRNVRVIGHSASTIADLRLVLDRAETGQLAPNRAVAAIGSLGAAGEGLQAVQQARYPGKIVIYPHIRDMPLTALPELRHSLPSVYARLKEGKEWTVEAEDELLRLMLP